MTICRWMSTLCMAAVVLFPLSGAMATPFTVSVESWGFNPTNGGFADLAVNGVSYGNPQRGMNLLEVDETTGIVLAFESFDTYASVQASNQMAAFINAIPAGRIVLAAIEDEGTNRMTGTGLSALWTLGASRFDAGFRGSWALIGIKGAAVGSVPQASARQGLGPVFLEESFGTFDPPSVVPEPSTLSLLLLGMLVLIAMGRLRSVLEGTDRH